MKIIPADKNKQIKKIKNLYYNSFPSIEQKPFSLILQKKKEGLVEIFSLEDNSGKFLGLIINCVGKNCVLLDYLAIAPKAQGRGLGSFMLSFLKGNYPERKIFIEIESTEINSLNNFQRIRRKAFYRKNGFLETSLRVDLFGAEMEILSNVKDVRFEDYIEVYKNTYGENFCSKIRHLLD